MLRNYTIEEKYKEIGIENPQHFIEYHMRENRYVDNETHFSFNFVFGVILGIAITLFFINI